MVSPITSSLQIPGLSGVSGLAGTAGAGAGAGAGTIEGTKGSGFGQAVGDALTKVGDSEIGIQKAAEAAATGNLSSINDYMVAAAQAQLTTEITVAVRDRAISAFNDIMRMQL